MKFNLKLAEAQQQIAQENERKAKERNQRLAEEQAKEAERKEEYQRLIQDTAPTLEVLTQVGHWLKRSGVLRFRLRHFASKNLVFDRYHDYVAVSYTRSGSGRIYGFGYDDAYCEGYRTELNTLDSRDGRESLTWIHDDQLARAIVQLADELGLEVPDIDVELPDPKPKSVPKAETSTSHRWGFSR